MSAGLSLALIGVGHLVGLSVGMAMLVGLLIGWVVLLPMLTAGRGRRGADLATSSATVFRDKVRFFGAGVIGVAAIWTLLKIIGPILAGIRSALVAVARARAATATPRSLTERDIPIGIVGGSILAAR